MWTKNLNKKRATFFAAIGIALGFLIFAGLRMALIQDHHTHYHANFGLFINGQRDEFKSFAFYEEVAACTEENNDPRTRTHMHDNINHVVHVHDIRVTWSDFFNSLGYTLGDGVIATGTNVYVDGQNGKQPKFILNGKEISNIANSVIGDKDVLLIDYGGTDLNGEYKQIPQDAEEVDNKADPATCSGSPELNFSERLKRAFDFTN